MEGKYFPILIDLNKFPVLIVGGGTIALRKVQNVIEFGIIPTLVSPEINSELQKLADDQKIIYKKKFYESTDIKSFKIVFAATANPEVDKLIEKDCNAGGILLNVADVPDLCNFIMPSTIKRGNLTISVASQGKAPFFTKAVKEKIEKEIEPEYSVLADLAALFREKLLESDIYHNYEKREILIQKFNDFDWISYIKINSIKMESFDKIENFIVLLS